jgi:SAM-dependent methyltransferase
MPSPRQLLHSLRRAARDRNFRRDLLWRRLPRPPGVFQVSGDTREDRYPEILRFVGDRLDQRPGLRLLSFGCSTGEEVFTLRRYAPNAMIDGIDVNPYRIRTCLEQLLNRGGDAGISFAVAATTAHLPDAAFDAIFCMAVLRHGELRLGPAPRCDHLIRFEMFDRITQDFARCLKPGGYLAIVHSNFRFADARAAGAFDPVMSLENDASDPVTPLYGRDNRLLPGVVYRDVVFRKHSA